MVRYPAVSSYQKMDTLWERVKMHWLLTGGKRKVVIGETISRSKILQGCENIKNEIFHHSCGCRRFLAFLRSWTAAVIVLLQDFTGPHLKSGYDCYQHILERNDMNHSSHMAKDHSLKVKHRVTAVVRSHRTVCSLLLQKALSLGSTS